MADPVVCSGECTVSVQVAPVPLTPEEVADIGVLFGLLLVACVMVYCAKQLLNLFKVNSNPD